jgi:hypothetical protein
MQKDYSYLLEEEKEEGVLLKILKGLVIISGCVLLILFCDVFMFGGSIRESIYPPTIDSVRNVQYSYNATIKATYKNNTQDTFNVVYNDMGDVKVELKLGDLSYWRHTGFGGSRRITLASNVNTYKVIREQVKDSLVTYEYFEK